MIGMIMFIHAIPVLIAGLIWGRGAATIIAIISGIIAAVTGNPRYTIHDIVANVISCVVCLIICDNK